MKAFQPSSYYQVMFSLMTEDPAERMMDWDIELAISSKLDLVA